MIDTPESAVPAAPPESPLVPADVPVGHPIDWPILDQDGTLLLERGATLVSEIERDFLFRHFVPQRGDRQAAASSPDKTDGPDAGLNLGNLQLGIGALMGLRPQEGASGAPMRPCKLVGIAPNDAILVTLPYHDGRPMELTPGENVDIVAVAGQGVYRFVCTLDAICHAPFGYLVLSKPANIRMLRERQSIRVRAQFPVRYGIGGDGGGFRGVALARSVSALGLSLCAPWALGKTGERLHIGFRLRSGSLETAIDTSAVIRNGYPDDSADAQYTLGLELDSLTPVEQMAMKVYMFDRRDEVLYWTSGPR